MDVVTRSYLPAPGTEPPGVPTEAESRVRQTYVDTPDLALHRRGAVLRCTEGGEEPGWRLELPVTGEVEVTELPLSGAPTRPPKRLRDLLLGYTLGEPLVPVATVEVRRTVRVLPDAAAPEAGPAETPEIPETGDAETAETGDAETGSGSGIGETAPAVTVTEVAVVSTSTLPGTEPVLVSHRVWTVAGLDAAQVKAVGATLKAAGARRTREAMGEPVLADLLGTATPEITPDLPRPKPGKAAGRVLHRYLAKRLDDVLAADLAVRRRDDDGVHDLRVALRRIRSALATFRPVVDRAVVDAVTEQLREVAHLLGDARDAEVVHSRLRALVDEEPADLRLGVARRTLGDEARAAMRQGRATADTTLRSTDYLALLRGLTDLVADPPWTGAADELAGRLVPERLRRDLRRARARVAAIEDVAHPAERARLMHEARKAIKRLRYACEAAVPVLGADAERLAVAAKQVQSVLGEHQDTMMTRSVLRRLAGRHDLQSGTAFTLGRLHAREEQTARRIEADYGATWAALDRPRVVGWL